MALYRTVSVGFWSDSKVMDEFTPEDRYFYLYLFTNPHTNLCGCFEISFSQMVLELGYEKSSIENLLRRFETVHNVLRYSEETKEILLLNWHKYNWTSSAKYRKRLIDEAEMIKDPDFQLYITELIKAYDEKFEADTLLTNDGYPIPTVKYGIQKGHTNTNTISNSNSISSSDYLEEDIEIDNRGSGGKKEEKKEKPKTKRVNAEKVNVYYESIPLNSAFTDYVEMRKKIRKPLATVRAVEMAKNKLLKLATDSNGFNEELAIQILDQSVFRSWAGLFELKSDYQPQRTARSGTIDWDNV